MGLPILFLCLWLLRNCCCDQDEEDATNENKNLSFGAQVIAWFLSLVTGLLLLALLVWASLLLVGETRIYNGVETDKKLINSTIPLVGVVKVSAFLPLICLVSCKAFRARHSVQWRPPSLVGLALLIVV